MSAIDYFQSAKRTDRTNLPAVLFRLTAVERWIVPPAHLAKKSSPNKLPRPPSFV